MSSFHEPLPPAAAEIELGHPQAFGHTMPTDVLRLAALGAAPGANDVLERAIVADAALRGHYSRPDAVLEYEPPSEERPWSRAVVQVGDSQIEIARGQPRQLVDQLIRPSAPIRLAIMRDTIRLTSENFAPLGIAYRRENGEWWLAGYLPVRGWTRAGRHGGGRPFDYHPVWDITLRLTHWTWVTCIVVLTVSGYFLAEPRWIAVGYTGQPTGYFIGVTRLVHYIAGVLLILVLIIRAYNLTTSRISYDRWKSLIPFKSKRDVDNGWKTIKSYAFIKPEQAPVYFGHNPIQQFTYTAVYLILVLQAMTGLALWGLYDQGSWFFGLFSWITEWIGTAQVRLLHYMIMWGLIVFIPAHVYLSVRADSVERMGAISSMVSGGRWVRRGAVFEDWPNPDGGNTPVGITQTEKPEPAAAEPVPAAETSAPPSDAAPGR